VNDAERLITPVWSTPRRDDRVLGTVVVGPSSKVFLVSITARQDWGTRPNRFYRTLIRSSLYQPYLVPSATAIATTDGHGTCLVCNRLRV